MIKEYVKETVARGRQYITWEVALLGACNMDSLNIEFTDKDAIKFFEEMDCSVDYLSLKDLSEEEIIQKGVAVAEEKNKWAKKYNEMSDEDKRKNQAIVSKCEMLDFKMMSIRDIVWMKQGHLKIKLPKIDTEEKKENGINKIRKFFGRR